MVNPIKAFWCAWNYHVWAREEVWVLPFRWRCRRCGRTSIEKRPDGLHDEGVFMNGHPVPKEGE